MICGLLFGQDIWSLPLHRGLQRAADTFFWSRFLDDLETSNPWLLVVRGVFWAEASHACQGMVYIQGHANNGAMTRHCMTLAQEFGARAQHDLTRAFSQFSLEESHFIYSFVETAFAPKNVLAERIKRWEYACRGALSVCRVAQTFIEAGHGAFLATVRIDIDHMIDVVIQRENHPLLCLQIKSERRENTLFLPEPGSNDATTNDFVARFSAKYGVDCIGGSVYINLGLNNTAPWDTSPTEEMRETLQSLLR